jgi:acyl-CoA reductase-like NAD-dependent aldehyde dehydrogenase
MLEFTEVSAMERCSLCGTLLVNAEGAVRERGEIFCTPRCARVSTWYVPAPPASAEPAPPAPERVHAVDPRSGERGLAYAGATDDDVREAVARAADAFRYGALAAPELRAALLRRTASALRDARAQIVELAARETGLPDTRLTGELERTARQQEAFADLAAAGDYVEAIIDRADADAQPIARPDLRRMLVPIGPVAVFGASNFPLAFGVAGGDTASALAAGCPVVVKGHPSHPGTSELVATCLSESAAAVGADAGVFGLLQSAGRRVGELLVEQEELEAVAFTGSFRGGRALFERAARRRRPIPVFAEMGSVNPVAISRAALAARRDAIAEGLAASVTGSTGQLCTKPGLVLVPAGEDGERFVDAVAERLGRVEAQPLLNETIDRALRERVELLAGVAERAGEARIAELSGFLAFPDVFRTTAARVAAEPLLREEVFGPVVVLAVYEHVAEIAAVLTSLEGELTATVHLEEGDEAFAEAVLPVARRVAGRVVFDGFPTGVAVCHAMSHGGPFPATTSAAHTSVGTTAVARFLRPLTWQSAPQALLPPELRDENPRGIRRCVDGEATREPLPDHS